MNLLLFSAVDEFVPPLATGSTPVTWVVRLAAPEMSENAGCVHVTTPADDIAVANWLADALLGCIGLQLALGSVKILLPDSAAIVRVKVFVVPKTI
jgi:hypothetical protein